MNKALTQMDEVTQRNAALVEENAATAKTLEQQARAMDERVAYFRLADGQVVSAIAAPAAKQEKPAGQVMRRAASGGAGRGRNGHAADPDPSTGRREIVSLRRPPLACNRASERRPLTRQRRRGFGHWRLSRFNRFSPGAPNMHRADRTFRSNRLACCRARPRRSAVLPRSHRAVTSAASAWFCRRRHPPV